MADKQGHLEEERRFGGNIRLNPPSQSYGKVRDAEQGVRKRAIEEIQEQRKSKDDNAEVWEKRYD